MANRIFYIIEGRKVDYSTSEVSIGVHGAYPSIKLAIKAFEQKMGWLCSHLHAEIIEVDDNIDDWKHTTCPLQAVLDYPNGERRTWQLRWDYIYEK